MQSEEKEVSYQATNTYSTLNKLTDSTKHVWFVCHGLGYLSKYFIQYFKHLNPVENFIIAPQAPSKYYQTKEFKHVGASWLTKENTKAETNNILHYFDAVLKTELTSNKHKLIVFGYSQGVSVAMRYLASRQLHCDELVLHSGGIPKELTAKDFEYFKGNSHMIYGSQDPYLNEKRLKEETEKARSLFGNALQIHPFEGVHEMNLQLIADLIN